MKSKLLIYSILLLLLLPVFPGTNHHSPYETQDIFEKPDLKD